MSTHINNNNKKKEHKLMNRAVGGLESRSNRPNPTEPKSSSWIQMAWSVGYGSTFFENRFRFGWRVEESETLIN